MGCWKCTCGRYVDIGYDVCIFCSRPKPGTVKPGELGSTLVFDFTNKGRHEVKVVSVKGAVKIGTDSDHTRIIVKGVLQNGGEGAEFESFEWINSIPHGSPLQIWPLQEGGFEVMCTSPAFEVNGSHLSDGKESVPTGSLLKLNDAMVIKLEDYRGAAFIAGTISPVGCTLDDESGVKWYVPEGSTCRYYNGLNERDCTAYSNRKAVRIDHPEVKDWMRVNKQFLSLNGIRGMMRTVATLESLRSGLN